MITCLKHSGLTFYIYPRILWRRRQTPDMVACGPPVKIRLKTVRSAVLIALLGKALAGCGSTAPPDPNTCDKLVAAICVYKSRCANWSWAACEAWIPTQLKCDPTTGPDLLYTDSCEDELVKGTCSIGWPAICEAK